MRVRVALTQYLRTSSAEARRCSHLASDRTPALCCASQGSEQL